MKLGFKTCCILGEDERMDIKFKWNACASKLINPFLWIEPASHADLEDIITE